MPHTDKTRVSYGVHHPHLPRQRQTPTNLQGAPPPVTAAPRRYVGDGAGMGDEGGVGGPKGDGRGKEWTVDLCCKRLSLLHRKLRQVREREGGWGWGRRRGGGRGCREESCGLCFARVLESWMSIAGVWFLRRRPLIHRKHVATSDRDVKRKTIIPSSPGFILAFASFDCAISRLAARVTARLASTAFSGLELCRTSGRPFVSAKHSFHIVSDQGHC